MSSYSQAFLEYSIKYTHQRKQIQFYFTWECRTLVVFTGSSSSFCVTNIYIGMPNLTFSWPALAHISCILHLYLLVEDNIWILICDHSVWHLASNGLYHKQSFTLHICSVFFSAIEDNGIFSALLPLTSLVATSGQTLFVYDKLSRTSTFISLHVFGQLLMKYRLPCSLHSVWRHGVSVLLIYYLFFRIAV